MSITNKMKDSKKKVLAIVPTLSKRSGGGRLAYELVSRLQEVTDLRILTEIGMDTSSLEARAILEPRTPLFGFIRNCFRVRRAASGVEIVHAFDAWPYGVYGYCAVLGTKRRLIINGVGTYAVAPLLRRSTRFILSLAYRRASAILCISAYTKNRIDEELLGLPTSIMHMGTTALPIPSTSQIAELRKRLAIPDTAYPIVVTVGEIKERKGQLDTLQAIVSLKQEFPHALYIMAGSDTDMYVADIRSYAEKYAQAIRITSSLKSDEDLSSLYSIADVFALNSNNHETHFEGFGLVILEAAQFGVPAIGSKGCGIEDAIEDGVSGRLVAQMDHAGIRGRECKRISNHDAFKAGALAWYTRFTWEKAIDIILATYEQSS